MLATAAAYNSRKRGELYSFGPTTQRKVTEQDVREAFKIDEDEFVPYDNKDDLFWQLREVPDGYSGLILIENSEKPNESHLIEMRRTLRRRLDIMDRRTGLPAELPDGRPGQYTFKLGEIVESRLTDGLVELDGLQPAPADRPDPRQLVREIGEGRRDKARLGYLPTLKAILNEISLTRIASLGMDVGQVAGMIERRYNAEAASQVKLVDEQVKPIDEIVWDVAHDLKVVKHWSPSLPEPVDVPVNNEAGDPDAAAGTRPWLYGIELFEKMHADVRQHVLADGTVGTRTYRVVAAGAAEQAANRVGEQVRSGFAYARAVYLAGWPNPEELPAETDIDVVTDVTEHEVPPSPGAERVRISVREESPALRSVARMVFAEFSLMRLQVLNLHPNLMARAALERHGGDIRDGSAVRATVKGMAHDLQARKADVVAAYAPETVTFEEEGDAELTGENAETAYNVGKAWFDRAFVDHRERDGSDEAWSARSGDGPVTGGERRKLPRIFLNTYDNERRGGRSGGEIKAERVVALIREAVSDARRMALAAGLPPADVPHPWDVPVTVISTNPALLPGGSLGRQRRQVQIVLGESTPRPETGQISTWLNDQPEELLSPDEPRTASEQAFPRLPDDPVVNKKHKLLVTLSTARLGPGTPDEVLKGIRDALEFQRFFHGRDASPFTDFEPVKSSGIEGLAQSIERVRGAGPGALSFLVGYREPFRGHVWVLVNLGRDDEGDLVYIVDPSSGDKLRVRNVERVPQKQIVEVEENGVTVRREAIRSVTVTDLVAEDRGGAGGKDADGHDRPARWVLKERRWEIKESRQDIYVSKMRIEKISETKTVTSQNPHGTGNPVTREKWPENSLPGLDSIYEVALDARENPVDVSRPPMYAGQFTHTPDVAPSRFGFETVMVEGGVEALRAFESHTGKSADLLTRHTLEQFGTGGDGVRQVLQRMMVAKDRDPRNRDAFTVMLVRGLEEPSPEAEAEMVRRNKLPGLALARAYVVRFDGDELTIVDPRTGVVVSPADFGYAGVIEAVGISVSTLVADPVDADGEYVSPPEKPGDAGNSGPRVGGGPGDEPVTEGDANRPFGAGPSGSGGRSGLPTDVTGPNRRGGGSAPTDQAAQQDPRAEKRKQQAKRNNAKQTKKRKAATDRYKKLEAQEELTPRQAEELVELWPKVTQWEQNGKTQNAKYYKRRKAATDRFAYLEAKEKLTPKEGEENLTPLEAEELAELRPQVAHWKQQDKAKSTNRRQKGKAAKDRLAYLEARERQGQLTPGQQDELRLRREIAMGETEVNTAKTRRWRRKNAAEEIKNEKEARDRLAKKKQELKLMLARGEAGSGQIAGVGASGQQDVDLGASVDAVMGDSGGDGRAAASLSDVGEGQQAEFEALQESEAVFPEELRETQRELDEQGEQAEGATRDEEQDLRVVELWESLEQVESYLADLEALPSMAEVLRAESATLPSHNPGLRRYWEETKQRIAELRAEWRAEIELANAVAKPIDVAVANMVVRHTHDVIKLARSDARVPLADVVALVAAQHPGQSPENQARAIEFSRTLAEKLDTQGNSLRIHAGAGSSKPEPESVAAGQLLSELNEATLSDPASAGVLPEPDLFGLLTPADPPEFLRGHDYSEITAGQGLDLLQRLDLKRPAPNWSDIAPHNLRDLDDFVLTRELPEHERGWAENETPLPAELQLLRARASVWLGGPLDASSPAKVELRENIAESEKQLRGWAPMVVFTDVPRAQFEEAAKLPVDHEPDSLAGVREMLAWAEDNNVALVNVHEVFHSSWPMPHQEAFLAELAKQTKPGYTASSDYLRVALGQRFGLPYSDGEYETTWQLLDGMRQALDSREAYGTHKYGGRVNNDLLVLPKGHPFADKFFDRMRDNYGKTQAEIHRVPDFLRAASFVTNPQLRSHRYSVTSRTGPINIAKLAYELGHGGEDRGAMTGPAMNTGGQWVARPRPQPSISLQDRVATVELTKKVVQTLVRELHNRDGDLHLTLVGDAVHRHEAPDVIWTAALGYLAQRPELAGLVRTVTDRELVSITGDQHEERRVELPEQARKYLRFLPGKETHRMAEYSRPAKMTQDPPGPDTASDGAAGQDHEGDSDHHNP
ncbi:hypothetical protein AB0L88_37265 [Saccharopolyspora shandongensis]|uniref:hypothetical protein n=1 Tax=Saccharopolyspora shandongensis TaxID=418495 RepID=UPI00341C63B1